jgi:adenylate cyclase
MHSQDGDRVERRLAAILAADVAGYSRLMGADEEGTHSRMKALRHDLIDARIADHRGRIVKTTGDGMLVEFPSVVEAVRCAIEMQQEMVGRNAEFPPEQRIEFRIGINVGDVIIDGDDIYGDGVNVAARLEALADPGGICISGVVCEQVRDKLALDFEDMGERDVKNIARPVRAYRIAAVGSLSPVQAPPAPTVRSTSSRKMRRTRVQFVGTVFILLIVMIGGWIAWSHVSRQGGNTDPTRQASIAVLPFANLSDDPQQDYFSDGLTDGILTSLTRFPELFVIARNSTFIFKGKPVEIVGVGRTLGVRYVLEGSVQKSAERVRITAQLIDAKTGGHLWADQYDRPLADVFAVQDEITEQIVTTLVLNIARATVLAISRKPLENLTAYELYLRGRDRLRTGKKSEILEAEKLFERAAQVDPEFASAHAGLAYVQYATIALRWDPEHREEALEKGLAHAKRAIGLDPALPLANQVLADLYIRKHEFNEAVAWGENAIRLNPSDAESLATLANVYSFAGRAADALPLIQRAIRLDPFHSPRYDQYLGRAYLLTGQYSQAVSALRACSERAPDRLDCPLYLSAALGQLGRIEEAHQALAIAQGFLRRPSLREVNAYGDFRNGPEFERLLEGLRKAGLPDD